ncbi:uncharacterized protein MONBRDRAFT_11159 [Monosiga brevicollis MX1]|uniref:DDE Tnp4 domain-containing protein n=1 Tax=Monosiga brevicollis TaxID=81824 RepID=A9V8D6_MONBE|nr:uncharacterized protein MONBRDRAFT_11159 [Monosiga brevicollis MX1]EDQ86322.1 predicted protein [Monosiga brevicollis MX1]|eukprot:XP_001748992.1 hypothetical protein [Monosiga brevicollis MX1]
MVRPHGKVVLREQLKKDKRFTASQRRAAFAQTDRYALECRAFIMAVGRRRVEADARRGVPWPVCAAMLRHLWVQQEVARRLLSLVVLQPPCRVVLNGQPHVPFDSFSTSEWQDNFGLTGLDQLDRLAAVLPFEDGHFIVPTREALLAFFAVFHRPGRQSVEGLQRLRVSWSASKISIVVRSFSKELVQTFHSRILFDKRYFTRSWRQLAKIAVARKFSDLEGIFAVIHRTGQSIARASGDTDVQQSLYSSIDSRHELRYQAIVTPNGLITSFYGPFEGLLARLESMIPVGENCKLLDDQAYEESRLLTKPRQRGTAHDDDAASRMLGRARIACERAIGANDHGVESRFEGLHQPQYMRVQQRPVLSNMLLCDEHTNPVHNYFDRVMPVPTLAEYMSAEASSSS